MRYVLMMIMALGLSACSIFPYHEDFSCQTMNSYGRCLDVDGAYEMAVTGQVQGEEIGKKATAAPEAATVAPPPARPDQAYRDERYKKLARLIQEPRAPLVKQPEVVRLLLLHYSDPKKPGSPLYGHRFIYFLGSDPEWILEGEPSVTETPEFIPTIVE